MPFTYTDATCSSCDSSYVIRFCMQEYFFVQICELSTLIKFCMKYNILRLYPFIFLFSSPNMSSYTFVLAVYLFIVQCALRCGSRLSYCATRNGRDIRLSSQRQLHIAVKSS